MISFSPILPVPPARPHGLLAVRVATVLGPLIFWGSVARLTLIVNGYFAPPGCISYRPPDELPILGIVLVLITVGLPYLHILLRLAGPNPKGGLALAMMTGTGGFLILPAAILFAGPGSPDAGKLVGGALMLSSQALLVALATKAFRSLGRQASERTTLLFGLYPTVFYFVLFIPLFMVADADLFPARQLASGDLSLAVEFTVTNMMEREYAAKHQQSYSPTLDDLGPGFQPKAKGYAFTYTAGPQGADGKIKTYTLSARPAEPCPSHCSCSFIADETGAIHKTEENRPATLRDPPLPLDELTGRGAAPQM
jgi:hypothetical protein